jgi:hypothetical protein
MHNFSAPDPEYKIDPQSGLGRRRGKARIFTVSGPFSLYGRKKSPLTRSGQSILLGSGGDKCYDTAAKYSCKALLHLVTWERAWWHFPRPCQQKAHHVITAPHVDTDSNSIHYSPYKSTSEGGKRRDRKPASAMNAGFFFGVACYRQKKPAHGERVNPSLGGWRRQREL